MSNRGVAMNVSVSRSRVIEDLLNRLCNKENHELRTPNEGINQRYPKNWANVADKICFGRT